MPKPKRYFETFALKTSFQGFQELLHAKGWCEKSFWSLTIVVAIVFSTLLIYLGSERFFKEPVATTVTRSRVGPVKLGILFCPANWIDGEKLGRLKNVSQNFLAYALSSFRDNYPKGHFHAPAPITFEELRKTDFKLHMRRMLKNILLINLLTNQNFGEVWRNLKLEVRFFLNAEILDILIEAMSAEQVGRATILYAQKDYVGLAAYVMTQVRLDELQIRIIHYKMYYGRTIKYNQTEYSQLGVIFRFIHNLGTEYLLYHIRDAVPDEPGLRPANETESECDIAPLLCCNDYGENCGSWAKYPASGFTPEELLLIAAKIEARNLTALYAYVQECLEQKVSEAINMANGAPSALTDEIWDYYQILVVEYIVSESYRTRDDQPFESTDFESWLPYEEIANFRFIRAYMEKAALYKSSSFPTLFEDVQAYVKQSAKFLEFLDINAAESSAESMRNFFAQTNNTSNAMDEAIQSLSQAIASWVAIEKENYANFLLDNNFANTNAFLQAISPNASQIIYSLSLSEFAVMRPTTSILDIAQVFNELGTCFRFSLFAESISVHQLKLSKEKVIFPSFKYRLYLNISVAESKTLFTSNRATHLVFIGDEAFEDYPRNGVEIPSKKQPSHLENAWADVDDPSHFEDSSVDADESSHFENKWVDVDFNVSDFVYHSKQNRRQAPCRSDQSYSSKKCVEACNDKFANGEYACSYLLENDWKFYNYACSIFHFMETSVLTASTKQNYTNWDLLNNCYADCNPSCEEWFMKVSISDYKYEPSDTISSTIVGAFDNATTAILQGIGNPKGEPIEIPNGRKWSAMPEVRRAITRNATISLTCINLAISTEVTLYFEEFTFTWDTLFGIVGGQIGLVMGASVMSFVQLGYLIFATWKKERNVKYTVNRQPSVGSVPSSVP